MCCGFLDQRANIFQNNHQYWICQSDFLSRANDRSITVRFLGIMERRLTFFLSECTFKGNSGKCKESFEVVQWPAAHEKRTVIIAQH